eukprot:8918628-Karenia_brevis.AAC.1
MDFGLHLGTQEEGDEGGTNELLEVLLALGAKMAPRSLHDRLQDQLWTDFGPFWTDFEPFWNYFGT